MSYSSKADVLKVLSSTDLAQLTDDTNGTTIDDAIVDAHIAKADNTINIYCRGKNDLPFNTTTTPKVKDWSVTLAVWYLYRRRVDLEMPEPVRTDYEEVIEELEKIRDGKALVNDPDSAANTASFYKGDGGDKATIFDTQSDGSGVLDQYYNGPV